MYFKDKMWQVLKVFLLISLLFLSGCGVDGSERTKKPPGDWSRGLFLGESDTKQPVALEIDAQKHVHIVWRERATEDKEDKEGLHYIRLDQRGQIVVDEVLSIDLPSPRRPQLLADGKRLHLALLSHSGRQEKLHHLLIGSEGQVVELSLVSTEKEDVGGYQMYLSASGELSFIWEREAEGDSGVYLTTLNDDAPSPLIPKGIDPFIIVDDSQTTHLVWLRQIAYSSRDVYYATLEGSQLQPPGGKRLSNFEFAESATYHGPILGLDSESVYILWSVQNLGGGLTPAAADAYYVSFPRGQPQFSSSRNIKIPDDHRPDYSDYTASYQYSELALLSSENIYSTDFINAPAAVRRQKDELPVAVSLILQSASKSFMQLAMVVFSDGAPVGYQVANRTSNASVIPTLTADADANLHLAWIDTAGFRRYKVYYSTTAPQAKEWLDRTTIADIGRGAADLAWGILSAIGFLPLALMWNTPALVWLVLFYLFSRQEHLAQLAPKIGLGVSFVIYTAAKLLFMPGLLSAGTPFVHQLPEQVASILVTALPIFILILGLIAVYIYIRRSKGREPSVFKAYLAFALTDSLLTATLYAPRFFNPRG